MKKGFYFCLCVSVLKHFSLLWANLEYLFYVFVCCGMNTNLAANAAQFWNCAVAIMKYMNLVMGYVRPSLLVLFWECSVWSPVDSKERIIIISDIQIDQIAVFSVAAEIVIFKLKNKGWWWGNDSGYPLLCVHIEWVNVGLCSLHIHKDSHDYI